MTKAIFPDGNLWVYEYNKSNNLVREIFLDGHTCQYKYNSNNDTIKYMTIYGVNYSIIIE